MTTNELRTADELRALRHAAEGSVLFHNGLWGGPMGFMWAAPDGCAAGRVPQWESDALLLLERRRLVAISQGRGDVAVVATDAGVTLLSTLDQAA